MCPKSVSLHELIADAVLKGAIEARSTTVSMQHLEERHKKHTVVKDEKIL